MIQLNLLPDVKLEYIKAQRQRQLMISISVLVTAVAVAILVLLLAVNTLQKKHLNDLTSDITKESSKLKQEPNIDRILTVQNQLESLTALHDSKPAAARLFDYLNQLTPTAVGITDFETDFTQQTATITGTADALSSVNKYVDTLKYTTYKTDGDDTKTKAFSNVVLSSFSRASDGGASGTTYSVTLNYDLAIFDTTKNVSLVVPAITTTRSSLEQPSTDLFQAAPTTNKGTQ